MVDDTIVAPATPLGVGAIGIVRISGVEAVKIASRLFIPRRKSAVKDFVSHRLYLGDVFNPQTQEIVDEALLVVMRAPHSYTREDVVEFQLHGGPVVVQKVLELLLQEGARLAEPGEFTRRAFLNGRLDLSQAEAVAEIIKARSEKALSLSLRHLKGEWGRKIRSWESRLLNVLALVQARCDFWDEGEGLPLETIGKELSCLVGEIKEELLYSERLKLVQEGALVAVVGKPNVGKSSLFNAIVGWDRAIVTPFPGTTRDALEENILVDGLLFRLVDTAGMREGCDPIESIGVQKAEAYFEEADLVIVVLDQSIPLEKEDEMLAGKVKNKPHFIVLNKSDLPPCLDRTDISRLYPGEEVIEVSALQGEGIDRLLTKIGERIRGEMSPEDQMVLITARQKGELNKVLSLLAEARDNLQSGVSLDVLGLNLEEALREMGRILGAQVDKELLDTIFSQFCLGK
ncbi:MAG: tRNA modification GTPase [Candidatus Atribacteria bacterium]|nr:tRNA modification GTPase [Candidatus Atribacteria bacterium]